MSRHLTWTRGTAVPPSAASPSAAPWTPAVRARPSSSAPRHSARRPPAAVTKKHLVRAPVNINHTHRHKRISLLNSTHLVVHQTPRAKCRACRKSAKLRSSAESSTPIMKETKRRPTSLNISSAVSMCRLPIASASGPDSWLSPPHASQLSRLNASFITLRPSFSWHEMTRSVRHQYRQAEYGQKYSKTSKSTDHRTDFNIYNI